jgi:opacity protein-like surface antigen
MMLAAAGVAAASAGAEAQSGDGYLLQEPRLYLQVRGGFNTLLGPRNEFSDADLFGFTRNRFTIGEQDFNTPGLGLDVGLRLSPRLHLVGSLAAGDTDFISEDRDFEEDLGNGAFAPINQTNYFYQRSIDFWARYYLIPPGRRVGRFAWIPNRVAPFVGAGVGFTTYEFNQFGDFVDEGTLEIFSSDLTTTGTAVSLLAAAGLQVNVASRVYLTGDVRYRRGSAGVGGDFVGFDDVDLSGFQWNAGIGVFF